MALIPSSSPPKTSPKTEQVEQLPGGNTLNTTAAEHGHLTAASYPSRMSNDGGIRNALSRLDDSSSSGAPHRNSAVLKQECVSGSETGAKIGEENAENRQPNIRDTDSPTMTSNRQSNVRNTESPAVTSNWQPDAMPNSVNG